MNKVGIYRYLNKTRHFVSKKIKHKKLPHEQYILLALAVILTATSGWLLAAFTTHTNSGETIQSKSNNVAKTTGITGNSTGTPITNFSRDDLLAATNSARTENSLSPLTINEQLNTSAQAKCEDMVKKNYWSHNTPEGDEPWVFVTNAGYKYSKLGENLAVGFSGSKATITGWMNSPEHRKNLLDGAFQQVGFGICESKKFITTGRQSILVVQHLGTPATTNTSSVAPTTKPYVPVACSKTVIPFTTETIEVSYLYVGETQVGWPGTDGYTETCTPDSNGYAPPPFTIQPISRTVYVGTKPKPDTTP